MSMPTPGTLWYSPDCMVGKCRACRGDAWDLRTDQPTPCQCDCHEEATAA